MSYNRENELYLLKQIEPFTIFNQLGIEYKYNSQKKEYWHLAPWRNEKQESVKWIYKNGSWIWYDFGENVGGSLIDFWMFYTGKDYKSTMQELRAIFLNQKQNKETTMKKEKNTTHKTTKTTQQQQQKQQDKNKDKNTIIIKKINNKIQNQALLQYLKTRKIYKIPSWLKEVYWSQNDRNYFGVAIEDINKNYICRNKYMKANLSEKITYSWIKQQNNSHTVIITEGLFDALTAYQIYHNNIDILCLNSVSNLNHLIKNNFDFDNYNEIKIAFDNDSAGEKAYNKIIQYLEKFKIKIEKIEIEEDLNQDWIKNKIIIKNNKKDEENEKNITNFEPF